MKKICICCAVLLSSGCVDQQALQDMQPKKVVALEDLQGAPLPTAAENKHKNAAETSVETGDELGDETGDELGDETGVDKQFAIHNSMVHFGEVPLSGFTKLGIIRVAGYQTVYLSQQDRLLASLHPAFQNVSPQTATNATDQETTAALNQQATLDEWNDKQVAVPGFMLLASAQQLRGNKLSAESTLQEFLLVAQPPATFIAGADHAAADAWIRCRMPAHTPCTYFPNQAMLVLGRLQVLPQALGTDEKAADSGVPIYQLQVDGLRALP